MTFIISLIELYPKIVDIAVKNESSFLLYVPCLNKHSLLSCLFTKQSLELYFNNIDNRKVK